MIVGIIAVIAMIFLGGGNETILLNPQMEKSVKTYVADKDKVKEIKHIIKLTGKKQAKFSKESKKGSIKAFKELNLDYQAKPEDFQIVLDEFFSGLEALQKDCLDSELQIKSLIKEEEWDNIMTEVVNTPEKEKVEKQLTKLCEQMKDHLMSACTNAISDSTALITAKSLVDEYQVKSREFGEELVKMGYKNHENLRQYNTPREDFEALSNDLLNHRKDYMNYIVDLRYQLKELVPASSWPDLAKAINKGISQ